MNELKRLIIVLGAMTQTKPDLKSAIELAMELSAELQALYIEDLNLFRLVELPLAQEISRSTGEERSFDLTRLQKLLRSQAYQIEQELMQMTSERELRYGFQVVRGHIAREIVTAGLETDLMFISESRSLLKQTNLIEKIIQEMLHHKAHITLFFHQHFLLSRGFEHRIAVIYDGTPLSERALDLAQTIFPIHRNELFVIIPKDDSKKYDEIKSNLKSKFSDNPHLRVHSLPSKEIIDTLLEMDKQQQLTSIIFPLDESKVKTWNLSEVLNHLKCNIILMK